MRLCFYLLGHLSEYTRLFTVFIAFSVWRRKILSLIEGESVTKQPKEAECGSNRERLAFVRCFPQSLVERHGSSRAGGG